MTQRKENKLSFEIVSIIFGPMEARNNYTFEIRPTEGDYIFVGK